MMKNKIKVLLLGILFSYIMANLVLAPRYERERFLAVGQVYELREKSLQKSNETWEYDSEHQLYTIRSADATMRYGRWNEDADWKCLYLKLDQLTVSPIDWVWKAYDEQNNFVGQQIITVQNGENWIALQMGAPFQRFSIQILGGEGVQFTIEKMILMEEVPQKKAGLLLFFLFLLGFIVVYKIVGKRFSVRTTFDTCCGRIWEFLQFCYSLIGGGGCIEAGMSWSRKKKCRVMTFLFLFLFGYMLFMYNQNLYLKNAYFRYHSLIAAIILGVIAFLIKEDTAMQAKWDSAVSKYWLSFWLLVCISDFAVTKRFRFVGWIMLFVVGFFFWNWQRMKHPEDVIWSFLHAAELLAVGGAVYNMIFRLKYDGLYYNGYMNNSSDFGALSAFLCLVFLIELYECWHKRKFGKRMAFSVCGLAIAAFQTLVSGKRTAIFFMIAAVAAVFAIIIRRDKAYAALAGKRIAGYAALAAGVACVYYLAVKHIPQILGTLVQYQGEKFASGKELSVIEFLASGGNPVYQKVKFYTVGQNIPIYKACLREMNLLGHGSVEIFVWNARQNVQNHMLQIMYRYGIAAVIFYVMLFWEAGKRAVRTVRYAVRMPESIELLAAGTFLFWGITGFFGNLEYPYYQPVWLLVYLLMGKYFSKE